MIRLNIVEPNQFQASPVPGSPGEFDLDFRWEREQGRRRHVPPIVINQYEFIGSDGTVTRARVEVDREGQFKLVTIGGSVADGDDDTDDINDD